MLNKKKYIFSLICGVIVLCGLSSCTEEILTDKEPVSEAGQGTVDPDGIILRFDMSLRNNDTTRDEPNAVDEETIIDIYDNKIDTDNMLQVLFFSEEGNFLFEAQDVVAKETADQNGQWYVTIPIDNRLTDTDEKSILGTIRNYLEDHSFKIAVLANWMHGNNPYKVSWGWNESYLNTGVAEAKTYKNINDLHHLVQDDAYTTKDAYSFLTEMGKMGAKTNWVVEKTEEEPEGDAGGDGEAVGTASSGMIGVEQYIPMYGVQNFNAISNWSNNILNLSQSGLNISLVRSVAKVEVYLPAERPVAFIGMRSMNRGSRCEPMDVETPTNLAWAKLYPTSVHDSRRCEWFDLQSYGPGYNRDNDYKEWLAWFYGSWNYKYQPNPSGTMVEGKMGSYVARDDNDWNWNFDGVTLSSSLSHPHIFNPAIDRADLCEFMKMDVTKSGYQRYMLYVPDKFIDDPDEAGNLKSAPKVMHVEYRYEKGIDEDLDDTNSHRIYFTDYSTNENIKNVYSDQFSQYEMEHTADLWPVMRNHVYRFFIGGDYVTQVVYVKVEEFTPYDTPKKVEW